MNSGALYCCTANATGGAVLRTLNSHLPDFMVTPPIMGWASTGPGGTLGRLNVSATAEFAASDTTLTIWGVSGGDLKFFMDVLALSAASPTLIGPEEASLVNMNPISGGVNDVVFTWNHIAFSTSYDLFVCTDPACMSSIFMYNAALGTGVGAAGLPVVTASVGGENFNPGTTYYWHVRTSTTGPLTSQWSETRSFTIESAAAISPTIGSPANGATNVGANPAFSWSPVAGATMYEFQLAVGTNFASPVFSSSLAETGIRPPVKLDEGMTYFWRVRAVAPIEGDWSTIANFTVAVPVEEAPPVEIVQQPPPQIVVETPPPPPEIVIPPAPEPPAPITPAYIWAIVIIGAILVIAVIVLIVRTRRVV
jgi:hypothetical protein